MTHNLRPSRPIASAGLPPALHSGFLINRTPEPIPREVYSACAVRVMHEGKIVATMFDPQHTTDVDEAIGLFRLMFAIQTPSNARPLTWETVPENIRRHFRFLEGVTV